MTPRRLFAPSLALAIALAAGAAVFGQQIWVGRGWRGRTPPKWATEADFDGAFHFCRGYYTSVRRMRSGSGWNTDYPGADNNFSVRLAELTRISVALDQERQPNHVVIRLDDPLLYRCGIVFMTDIGTAEFSDTEIATLRDYMLKGGFIWVDDTWGSAAWSYWVREISRVFTPERYPIVDIPPTHAIMHTLYDVKAVPQVPSISHWRRSGGGTSEQGDDSATVFVKGIEDDRGRLMILMTHNTDISDTWEREGEEPRSYFDTFSPTGYAIGVNVVIYAMTH
ncbi:MAG: DUF4159 domain-containing protein [Acidobacteria bacterium]|nr:DUF4159 domain-containing protein [Acidobacteriota bacterium]